MPRDRAFAWDYRAPLAEVVRSSRELWSDFTGRGQEQQEVRAMLELGHFLLPQMEWIHADASDIVTNVRTRSCDIIC